MTASGRPPEVELVARPSVPVSCYRRSGAIANARQLTDEQQVALQTWFHKIKQAVVLGQSKGTGFVIKLASQTAEWKEGPRVVEVDLLVLGEQDPSLKTALAAFNALMATDVAKGERASPSLRHPYLKGEEAKDRAFKASNPALVAMSQCGHEGALECASRVKAPAPAAQERIQAADVLISRLEAALHARIQALTPPQGDLPLADDSDGKRYLQRLEAIQSHVKVINRVALYTALIVYEDKYSQTQFWNQSFQKIQAELDGCSTQVDAMVGAKEQEGEAAGLAGKTRTLLPRRFQGNKPITHDSEYARDVVGLVVFNACPAQIAYPSYASYCKNSQMPPKQDDLTDLIFRAVTQPTKISTATHRNQLFGSWVGILPANHQPQMDWGDDLTQVTTLSAIFDDGQVVRTEYIEQLLSINFQHAGLRRELQKRWPGLFKKITVEKCDVGGGNRLELRGALNRPNRGGRAALYSTWDQHIPMYCTGPDTWEAVVPGDLVGEFKPHCVRQDGTSLWLRGDNLVLNAVEAGSNEERDIVVRSALTNFQ